MSLKSRVLYQLSYGRILTISYHGLAHPPFRLYSPASPVSFFSSFKCQSYCLKSYDLATRQFDHFVMLQHKLATCLLCNVQLFNPTLLRYGCGGQIRTDNLQIMSLLSYRYYTPRYFKIIIIGAGGRDRTGTSVTSRDFKSRASANSATPASNA